MYHELWTCVIQTVSLCYIHIWFTLYTCGIMLIFITSKVQQISCTWILLFYETGWITQNTTTELFSFALTSTHSCQNTRTSNITEWLNDIFLLGIWKTFKSLHFHTVERTCLQSKLCLHFKVLTNEPPKYKCSVKGQTESVLLFPSGLFSFREMKVKWRKKSHSFTKVVHNSTQ